MEREIREAQTNDLSIFEDEIFESRLFSNIQKYLQAMRKLPNNLPPVNLNGKKPKLTPTLQPILQNRLTIKYLTIQGSFRFNSEKEPSKVSELIEKKLF